MYKVARQIMLRCSRFAITNTMDIAVPRIYPYIIYSTIAPKSENSMISIVNNPKMNTLLRGFSIAFRIEFVASYFFMVMVFDVVWVSEVPEGPRYPVQQYRRCPKLSNLQYRRQAGTSLRGRLLLRLPLRRLSWPLVLQPTLYLLLQRLLQKYLLDPSSNQQDSLRFLHALWD